MRLSLRFVLPLILVLAGIAYATAPLVDQLTLRWFMKDIDIRASLIANTIQEPLHELLVVNKRTKVMEFFNRITQDERLFAIGYCAAPTATTLASRSFPADIRCNDLDRWAMPLHPLLQGAKGLLHVTVKPMVSEASPDDGRLVLVHDMSFITRRSEETKQYIFFLGLAVVVSLITVVIAQLSWRGWMSGIRALLRSEGLLPEFKPIARDLQRLIRELESDARAMKIRSPGRRNRCAPFFTVNSATRT